MNEQRLESRFHCNQIKMTFIDSFDSQGLAKVVIFDIAQLSLSHQLLEPYLE